MTSRSKLALKAPFNDLSFGQVAVNLTKALFERRDEFDISLFPVGNAVELSAFELKPELANWIQDRVLNRYKNLRKEDPCISLWHLLGSDSKVTNNSTLFTFHELNGATETEISLCGLHERVFVSSNFSRDVLVSHGASNVYTSNIGFDRDILLAKGRAIDDSITHFGLVGKWENRKNTSRIIKNWIKLFGNNPKYRLSCLVSNPFMSPEKNQALVADVFGGQRIWNVSFLPRLKLNHDVNTFYHSIDIDLSGLSSAEGWNLPAFNSTCIGKWSCVANHTAHRDWANEKNCVLVEPSGEVEPYDNIFFKKGQAVNQGTIFAISDESMLKAMQEAALRKGQVNHNGLELQDEFTYQKTLDSILKEI